ncbi:Hypothetical protein POVN_LOCUS363 [uncultured virus]|nr:Hypothetical protein POVN_LOCUS363 [uncultured virus]
MTDALDVLIDLTGRLADLRLNPKPQDALSLIGWIRSDGLSTLAPGLTDFLTQVVETPTAGFRPAAFKTPLLPMPSGETAPESVKLRSASLSPAKPLTGSIAPGLPTTEIEFTSTSPELLELLLDSKGGIYNPRTGILILNIENAAFGGDLTKFIADKLGVTRGDVALITVDGHMIDDNIESIVTEATGHQPITISLSSDAVAALTARRRAPFKTPTITGPPVTPIEFTSYTAELLELLLETKGGAYHSGSKILTLDIANNAPAGELTQFIADKLSVTQGLVALETADGRMLDDAASLVAQAPSHKQPIRISIGGDAVANLMTLRRAPFSTPTTFGPPRIPVALTSWTPEILELLYAAEGGVWNAGSKTYTGDVDATLTAGEMKSKLAASLGVKASDVSLWTANHKQIADTDYVVTKAKEPLAQPLWIILEPKVAATLWPAKPTKVRLPVINEIEGLLDDFNKRWDAAKSVEEMRALRNEAELLKKLSAARAKYNKIWVEKMRSRDRAEEAALQKELDAIAAEYDVVDEAF